MTCSVITTHVADFYGFASVAYFCSPPQFQPSGSTDFNIQPQVYTLYLQTATMNESIKQF